MKLKRLKRKQSKAKAEEERKRLAEAKRKAEEERKQLEAEKQQLAEAKRLEEERKRLAAEQRKIAEAKRKAEAERKRQEELAALRRKQESEAKRQRLAQAESEVVIDPSTGLMWQKKPDEKGRNWKNAKRYCQNLSLGGYSDWRLPSKEVLADYRMFVKKQIFDPYKRDQYYWSSTTYVSGASSAWGVGFSSGSVHYRDKANLFYVRCVHGIGAEKYAGIVEASEDTISCGFLSFGCEDPLKLPPYEPGFHLKHYRRVKVYANRYPWIGSEIELEQGDQVLVFASGKVTTCPHCGSDYIDQPPNRFLTMRIGESRDFLRFHGRQAREGAYRDFSAQGSGELQFTVRDWDSYPPPQNYYSDNTGSYLIDVFVYDREQGEAFKQLLRAMAKQNPEDTEFSAGAHDAEDFLKGALQHPKQESAGVWTEPVTGMKFRRIPGGSFQMGSPSSEEGRYHNETPHTVSVGEFWLGETEVTNRQYRLFKPGHDSKSYKGNSLNGDDQPAVYVNWHDAVAYAKWLSRKTGKRFRLPTEAEWEYAARGKTRTARYWGDDADQACGYASVSDPEAKREFGWGWESHSCNDGYKVTVPVGRFRSNAFGLFDMLGNVWEWTCSDYEARYDGSEQKCSTDSVSASTYSLRGGSWFHLPGGVRAANRSYAYPDSRRHTIGFRLAQDK